MLVVSQKILSLLSYDMGFGNVSTDIEGLEIPRLEALSVLEMDTLSSLTICKEQTLLRAFVCEM